jgi:hypothetical protein
MWFRLTLEGSSGLVESVTFEYSKVNPFGKWLRRVSRKRAQRLPDFEIEVNKDARASQPNDTDIGMPLLVVRDVRRSWFCCG